jgi:hypothetical protein
MASLLKDATSDVLSLKFPYEFECGNDDCKRVETADFNAAFVRDTSGNWFLDLGKVKGPVLIDFPSDDYNRLEELLDNNTVQLCPCCAAKRDANRDPYDPSLADDSSKS